MNIANDGQSDHVNNNKLTSLEIKSIASLAGVFGLRMFGLFLILPVLAIYADQLDNATPLMMGMALGVYGVSQALLQIPYGMLSDRFGRKPMIVVGLIIFALGGIVAALSDTIGGVILGRALQGAGAIASVILALTSDLTREQQRTKAMAVIGMSIGVSFMLAILLAPLMARWIGVPGMFILTSVLACIAIYVVIKVVPTPTRTSDLNVRAVPKIMLKLLQHPQLIRLDAGIFILHFVLTAMFVVVPIILVNQLALPTEAHWKVYLPSFLGSVVLMIPLVIMTTRKRWIMRVFAVGVCILLLAQCLLMWRPFGVAGLTVCLLLFFWGFNLLEAMLPSLISRTAPAAAKGSAMGVYNTFQFSGVFFGGLAGGLLYGLAGYNGVFVLCGLLLLFWVYLLQTAPPLVLNDGMTLRLPAEDKSVDWYTSLSNVNGVEEVIILKEEAIAYLKVDRDLIDESELNRLVGR